MLLVGSAPLWLSLPQPGALAISEALRVEDGGRQQAVSLPLKHDTRGTREHYRLAFELPPASEQLYLFIPTFSQRAVIHLAGHRIADTEERAWMLGLTSGAASLVPLPSYLLAEGRNVLDLYLEASGVVRGYLSPVYIGTATQLAPHHRVRVLLLEYLRLMVLASHLLIAIIVLVVWLYRPKESLFGWLAVLLLVSMPVYTGLIGHLDPRVGKLLPYAFMVNTASGLILLIMSLLISAMSVPRWLKASVLALPLGYMLLALSGLVPARLLVLAAAPVSGIAVVASLAVVGWGALVRRRGEAWLLLLPLLLAVLAGLHDIAVVAGWCGDPVFLSLYYRPLLLIGMAMILMRRLAVSLMRLDDVNAYLRRRLSEREAELDRLYQEERREAMQRVRDEERQRLTVDLHDGLSGHLASIIALAEREQVPDIERTAREALDDLRLVIHSLDIDDRELTVALSGFRERLERQLKRMAITLDWSIARLPEISGVTPAHALNVLRILQEAVTNAVKHGPATRITLRGDEESGGRARILVENDGAPCAPLGPGLRLGSGLANMRHRAKQLGGDIRLEALAAGSRLTLILPRHLPAPRTSDDGPSPASGAS